MNNKQCPFAVYDYECAKTDCRGCTIMIENRAKTNEGRPSWKEIKSLKPYFDLDGNWIESADGAER